MCAYRCALRPALRTVSRLALRGCYKLGRSNFEPLARSYRPANRRTFTAGRYPVAGNYSLIHVLLRCVLTLWPCARPAGQSGKVRKQCPSFQAVRIGVGEPFRKLRLARLSEPSDYGQPFGCLFCAHSPSCRLWSMCGISAAFP